jgi:hypothetical protein
MAGCQPNVKSHVKGDGGWTHLVLSGITDETLSVVESDVRRGGSVTLVVGNDFDPNNRVEK